MTPWLRAVYFASEAGSIYPRLARVLEYTAREHNPLWDIRVQAVAPSNLRAARAFQSDNSWKLEQWVQAVAHAPDGQRVLLIDADTFVLGPLDAVFDGTWDVAVTDRAPTCKFPVNGGVVAVHAGPRARAFMYEWLRLDRLVLARREDYMAQVKLYGGQNQTSLGILRTTGSAGAKVVQVPGLVWNCEDSWWPQFDPQVTRVVHVKSALRLMVAGQNAGPQAPLVRPLARLWRNLEAQANGSCIPNPLEV